MTDELSGMARAVCEALFTETEPEDFDPVDDWNDLGLLLQSLEIRGCYLMTNSVADPEIRRIASFHRSTEGRFPCVGSSEWGRFRSLGEAVLRASHEVLLHPRT